jgi:hypothetical protein
MIILIIIMIKTIILMNIPNMRTVIIIRAILMAIQIKIVIGILLITIMQKLETAYTRT